MTELVDAAARRRALTDLGSTLLVEAAAGTGKTALLAGRIVLLMASGAAPSTIAAITFTKLAADELTARVRATVSQLLADQIPRALKLALPEGLSPDQRKALVSASADFDRLTTSTIHGFCQELIRGYAVEADIDPGAEVMDGDAEDEAFAQVFDAWLSRRLSGPPGHDDPIAILARDDPRQTTSTLRELAVFRRKHRGAGAPAADLSGRPDVDFSEAVDSFRRSAASARPDDRTAKLLEDLEALETHFADGFAGAPAFDVLWRLARPPRRDCMRRDAFELLQPRHLGVATPESVALTEAFGVVDERYRRLLGAVGAGIMSALSVEVDEVLADYAAFKRRAALLDFDDLLERASRLLREHEPVRLALAGRFQHLLVDEFQDTDPLQCDIIFRLAAEATAQIWSDIRPRAGSLFLVGDPKQSIYQFRGAHVATYEAAKAAIDRAWPANVLSIVANFRSRRGVLTYVNATFSDPLAQPLQPGYVALQPTREDDPAWSSARRLTVDAAPGSSRAELQDAEAEAVAEACARLIGAPGLHDREGRPRPVSARDIALLAPTRNDLWRYERALAGLGLAVASQAGKALYRRQEAQDLVALVRVLADARDTVAFGALMRGPLVGLTDQRLLDIAEALPRSEDRAARFTVMTPPDQIVDPGARALVETLALIRRRARFTTPAQLLGEAIERLGVRVTLALRDPEQAAVANANVDLILERAGRYGVRGLRRFAADLSGEWLEAAAAAEGRAEVDGDAICIVTMHSAKGLEWPVVIPINAMVQPPPRERFVHRPFDNSVHWMLGDVAAPDLAAAVQADAESLARERARLWYVACTRAEDLLILPHVPQASDRAWSRIVDLRSAALPALDLTRAARLRPSATPATPNPQAATQFAREAEAIATVSRPIAWIRPSVHDTDRFEAAEVVAEDLFDDEASFVTAGGRLRGLVLHKLLEEILEEGLAEDAETLSARAGVLAGQLLRPGETDESLQDVAELAATTLRTLALPEIAALRPRLRAEVPIYAMLKADGTAQPMAGRVDAAAFTAAGEMEVVIDWKSDIAPGAQQFADHAEQLRLYLEATGAPRGALVYMSLARVRWVERTA
jgi:ATP-dependent exoDNAse (exonuclease V) beta subunit